MELSDLEDPFSPGSGHLPPYLAGREGQQFIFQKSLVKISKGKSPPGTMVLYGPRGMGKTTLLRWLKNEVEQYTPQKDFARVVWLTPDRIGSPADLWNLMVPSETLASKLIPEKVTAGVSAEGFAASADWNLKELFKESFQVALIDQCKKQPLILLMDEAHKMDHGLCNNLLNLHQTISPESPFMLVLAGTPGLTNFLSEVDATFIERSKMISIGRLGEQSSRDAIVKPLEDNDIQITDYALSLIIEDSQCYPYFLQEWGSSLWDIAEEQNSKIITAEHVKEAKTPVSTAREIMYGERRNKLNKLGLRSTTLAIAKVFQGTNTMSEDVILEIITDNLSVDRLNTKTNEERLQILIDTDFIWRPLGNEVFEPGMPSLMTNILNQKTEIVKIESDPKVERAGLVQGDDGNGQGY